VYSNGRIPDSALTTIPGGGRLLHEVARTWLAICADVEALHGWTPRPTGPLDAYRPYSGNHYAQLETFQRRYTREYLAGRPTKTWNGVTYWLRRGMATAAVPGTSNHGWACAVDVTGLAGFGALRYRQFAAVASRYGWTNTEGSRIGEPWHWVDVGTAHLVANGLYDLGAVPDVPSVTPPTPIEEPDLDANQAKQLAEAHQMAANTQAAVGDLQEAVVELARSVLAGRQEQARIGTRLKEIEAAEAAITGYYLRHVGEPPSTTQLLSRVMAVVNGQTLAQQEAAIAALPAAQRTAQSTTA
jgi:hypothetical protein